MTCSVCRDNGIVIDRKAGTWDVCSCAAGAQMSADIKKGEEDIAAGRLYPWAEVRRRVGRGPK